MPYLYLQQQTRFKRVNESDIVLVEAGRSYSSVVTSSGSLYSRLSLTQIEPILTTSYFCRVHTSYIVSLPHIVYFTNEIINLGAHEVPIGRKYKEDFLKRINLL